MKTHITTFAARPTRWAVLLSGLIVLIGGCRKPEDDLGLDLLDPADTLGLTRTDTLSLIAWSRPQDSIPTSVGGYGLFGSYVDPQFGKLTAGVVTQVRFDGTNVGPANPNWVCDSLVLSMVYFTPAPLYGDLDPQTIAVYRLDESLSTDSIYYSDRPTLAQNLNLVANAPLVRAPVTDDGPIIGGDSLPAQLRIPLDPALGAEFLSQFGQAPMSNTTSFLEYFKGLYIVPENAGQATGEGGICIFNLTNDNSRLTLYYHDSSVGTPLSFNYTLRSSVRYSTVTFDRAGTPSEIALADTTTGQMQVLLQALGGIRSEVRIPYLDHYIGTPYQAIAKAELILPVADHDEAYTPPGELFAFRKNSTGGDLYIPDQVLSSSSFRGALYDEDEQAYRVNITRYVQNVMNGNYANTGLGLVAQRNPTQGAASYVFVNRAVLNGPEHPDRPMRLEVTFTTY
ncbi:MAG TPA: DUF4270 family protein [Flavobacteriales bacterium]